MIPRPLSSQRVRMVSPPPSRALLDLQQKGFELPYARTRGSQPLSPMRSSVLSNSRRPTPSDLDKPLPLEPAEKKLRTSSVYSTDTTISNILRLYGGLKDVEVTVEDDHRMSHLDQPQAYRDIVAPLLIKRLSLNASLPAFPGSVIPSLQPSASTVSLPGEAVIAPSPPPDNRSAPSFIQFTHALRDRRNELVSPVSKRSNSADFGHESAYDLLSPPSPQVSSVSRSISISETPPLPGPLTGTVMDEWDPDMIPAALSPRSTCRFPPSARTSSVYIEDTHTPMSGMELDAHIDPFAIYDRKLSWYPSTNPSESSYTKLTQGFDLESPVVELTDNSNFNREISQRTTTAENHPSVKSDDQEPNRTNNRSSVNDILGSLSKSARLSLGKTIESSIATGRRLATGPTSDHAGDVDISSGPKRSNRFEQERIDRERRGKGRAHSRNRSFSRAYRGGQRGLVNVFEEVKSKVTGKSREMDKEKERKRRLKQSIVLVGPPSNAFRSLAKD